MESFYLREDFCKTFSWAIPSKEAVKGIVDFAEFDNILEIGAGTGVWAWLISCAGGIITPIDTTKISDSHYFKSDAKYFTKVHHKSDVNIKDFDTHLYCWPSYDDSWAAEYLKDNLPNKVIYIGEGWGGCCANDDFFGTLNDNYVEESYIEIPHWRHIRDFLSFYRRK